MTDLKDELAALRIEREPESGSRRWLGWLVALALVAAAAAGGFWWITRPQPLAVQVTAATERAAGAQAAVLNASGYVTARREATVSSKVTGKVVEVNVEEGQAVKEGQILARLDDSAAQAALALAQAQLAAARSALAESEVRRDQAKQTLDRDTLLTKSGVTTQADLEAAQADYNAYVARIDAAREQVNVAQKQVAVMQTDLENTVIRAPFSGIAISKDAQPGEMVSPVSAGGGFTRTGICTIVDMRSLEIDVDVNESYINRVSPGQSVTAVLDAYPDWQIPARVITVVPAADRQKATVMVRIAFEPPALPQAPDRVEPGRGATALDAPRAPSRSDELDPRLLPDEGVKVTFLREDTPAPAATTQPTVLVPKDAVVNDDGQAYVFVATTGTGGGDVVEKRAVRVGGTDGDRVEVAAGLHGGERVVVSPPAGLKDGSVVTIKSE